MAFFRDEVEQLFPLLNTKPRSGVARIVSENKIITSSRSSAICLPLGAKWSWINFAKIPEQE